MTYPIYLNLKAKRCFVLGGGQVALRKVKKLLSAGAHVTVASLAFQKEFQKLKTKSSKALRLVTLKKTQSPNSFLKGIELAFACTSDGRRNKTLTTQCEKRGIWVNQADDLSRSSFLVPALWQEGPLQVAVSTSGLSPLLGRRLKERAAKLIKPEELKFLRWLKSQKIRETVTRSLQSSELRQTIYEDLNRPSFLKLFKGKAVSKANVEFQRKIKLLKKKEVD